MADRTLTETEGDSRTTGQGRPEAMGVVVAHCRGTEPFSAVAVGDGTRVGREDGAELVVADPGVSRLHASLERRDDGVFVQDLGSHNGTFVDGTPVPKAGTRARVGAVIRMAKTLLVVVRDVSPYTNRRDATAGGLLGGAQLDGARDAILIFGATSRPALILGETGTGKELVARSLHEHSGRRGQLVALNCAAVPSQLIDAELFGHTRGAFSDAVAARDGLFKTADAGTLFLDELGELPLAAQAKLLRVLETGEVRAVGSDAVTHVDVRLVAATNRNLDAQVAAGLFREDLLHRIAGVRIALPRLADRVEDLPCLVAHFLGGRALASAVALEHLMLQDWPGNVRELRNVVIAALEVSRRNAHAEIELADVAAVMTSSGGRPGVGEDDRLSNRICAALRETKGKVPLAAEQMQMSRSALYESIKRLGIDVRSFRRR
ncbi:MAG: sigma 54-interacting transcriptional regulator [Polyangiaceae bacterium]